MKEYRILNIWTPSQQELKELLSFDGCVPVDGEVINQLIRNGWDEWSFSSIAEVVPVCEHGKLIAYYSILRDSILWPDKFDNEHVTFEYTKGHLLHIHSYDSSALVEPLVEI